MSFVETATHVVERLLKEGQHNRDQLVDAILPFMEEDVQAMRRKLAKKHLSLIISTLRDSDGLRLAFPSRDEAGNAIVVDLRYTESAKAMRDLAQRKRFHAYGDLRDADRLEERAYQLDMFAKHVA